MSNFCSNCGKKIEDNADVCLNCGVLVDRVNLNKTSSSNKKKNRFPAWAIILIALISIIIPFAILITFGLVVFGGSDGEPYDISDEYYDYEDDYNPISEGTIGDTLELGGLKITLNSISRYSSINEDTFNSIPEEGNEYLVFFVDVENVSSEKKRIMYQNFLGVSEYDYYNPDSFLSIEGVNYLGGKIEPGETIKGYVAFEIEKNWENFDLLYRNYANGNSITFYVTNDDININDI